MLDSFHHDEETLCPEKTQNKIKMKINRVYCHKRGSEKAKTSLQDNDNSSNKGNYD